MQQQTFASIEKAETKKVVVDKGGQGVQDNIGHERRQRAAGLAVLTACSAPSVL